MRHPITKIASLALVAPLAGAALFATVPAASAATAPVAKAASAAADSPYSAFSIKLRYPKTVKVNKKITYKLDAVNKGPYDADHYALVGLLPKGVAKLTYAGSKGTKCEWDAKSVVCWNPYVLTVGDADWVDITLQFKKGLKGKVKTVLGALVYDVPTGGDDLSPRALDQLGYKSRFFGKTATTIIK